MKKVFAALAAASLTSVAVFGIAQSASADDTTPVVAPTSQVATTTPDTTATPDASTDTTTPVVTPDTTTTVAPTVVATSPAVVAPPVVTPAPAIVAVAAVTTKTLSWVLPAPGTATNVTWPQAVYVPTATVACGTTETIQTDTYPYSTPSDIARTDALASDGILSNGEDSGWAISWNFTTVTGAVCPPPAGHVCTANGTDYTEDIDWTTTSTGAKELDGQAQPVDHYYPVSGNLQGLPDLTITETSTSTAGQSALAVLEVNPGGTLYPGGAVSSYETLSPVGPNADGTTNELTGLLYSSTITKAGYFLPGAQGTPEPLSWFITNQPNNSLISVGVHFQSSGIGTSIVTALHAGPCVGQAYVYPTVAFPAASSTPATCVNAATPSFGTYTLPVLPATEKYQLTNPSDPSSARPAAGTFQLTAGQSVTVVAHTLASAPVQQASFTYGPFVGTAETPTQSTDASAPCYVAPPVVTPPVVTPPVVTPPMVTTPTVPTSFVAPTVLGYTGGTISIAALVFGILAAMLGLGLVVVALIRKRHADHFNAL